MADGNSTFVINIELNAGNIGAQLNSELERMKASTTGLDGELNKVQNSLKGVDGAGKVATQSLSTTRYALYDAGRTATITGGILLGLATATAAVAIAWERDFAQVIRTTGVTGDEVDDLRGRLVGLAQQMPATFGDITQVAALAGQLGIAKDQVAGFTETVIKFTAASNLGVEEAGTAFGRLNALLPDVQGDFNALGSSIAKVGVESVATESQIVNISTQISSMGAYAGLTAAEVVGLSGALASVGAPPEISRGTITRLFTLMGKAISEGGDQLEGFARISGVSSAQFSAAFGTAKFGPIFQSFIEGLGGMSASGEDAVATLGDLGVKSVRDVPLLLRLAGAGDLLGQAFQDANQGYSEGTELNRQYGIVAETTAAKIQILVNNVMAFLDSVGSATTGPLKGFVDLLTDMVKRLTDFASTPFGQTVSLLVVGLSALLGAILLVSGALLAGMAGIIGMQQALAGLTGQTTVASVGLAGLRAQLIAMGGAGSVAAKGIGFVGAAMKAIGWGALIAGIAFAVKDLVRFGQELFDVRANIDGLSEEIGSGKLGSEFEVAFSKLSGAGDAFGNTAAQMYVLHQGLIDTARSVGDFTIVLGAITDGIDTTGVLAFADSISAIDTALTDSVKSGNIEAARDAYNKVATELRNQGLATDEIKQLLPGYTQAIKDSGDAAAAAVDPTEELARAEEAATQAAEQFAASMGLSTDELEAMQGALTSGSQGFFDMASAIKQATDDSGFSLDTFIQKLQDQLTAQQEWSTNMGVLAARGATNFVTELSALGPEGAQVAKEAVKLSDAELAKLEGLARQRASESAKGWGVAFTQNVPILQTAYKLGGDKAVASMQAALAKGGGVLTTELRKLRDLAVKQPINIYANDKSALTTLNNLQRQINATTGTVTVYAQYSDGRIQTTRSASSWKGTTGGFGYADGGHITGPGTGTSDSIHARLSNGEYVIRAQMVDKYGPGFFNALNSGKVPKFAGGGQVGGSSGGGSMIGGVMELGPKTIRALSTQVSVSGMGDVEISRAAQRGDGKRRAMGDL